MSDNQWTSKIEQVLKGIQRKCNIYKNKHNEISINSGKKYSMLMIASIVITPISGIINTIGSIITTDIDSLFYFTTASTIFSFGSGILVSITKFSQYDHISKSHMTASTRYTSLEHNIQRQLILERQHRMNAQEYLDWVLKKYDDLYASSPLFLDNTDDIFNHLENGFEDIHDKYNNSKDLKNTNSNVFTKTHDLKKYDKETMALEIKNYSSNSSSESI